MRYEITSNASQEIDNIAAYTNQYFGSQQTEEYLDGLFYSFDLLKDNPKIGRASPNTKIRRYIYRSHAIYYEVIEDIILIVDIVHTRYRDNYSG